MNALINKHSPATTQVFVTSYWLATMFGFSHGKWFNLTSYTSSDDFLDDAYDYLLSLGDTDPELCLSDFEGLHPALYSESPDRAEIDNMIEYANLNADLRLHFANGVKIDGKTQLMWRTPLEVAEAYSAAFRGKYDSLAVYAKETAWETGELDGIPDDIIHAIDWDVLVQSRFSDYNIANGCVYSPEF